MSDDEYYSDNDSESGSESNNEFYNESVSLNKKIFKPSVAIKSYNDGDEIDSENENDNDDEIGDEIEDDSESENTEDVENLNNDSSNDNDSDYDNESDSDEYDSDVENQIGGNNEDNENLEISENNKSQKTSTSTKKKSPNSLESTKIKSILEDEEDDDDYNEDNDGDDYDNILKKFNADIMKSYIDEFHPECLNHNYLEILKLTIITRNQDNIIIDPLHRTLPFLTKYEKTKILGQRAKQIESGATPLVKINENIVDSHIIAELELKENKIPFIIKRPLPNGGCEYWKVQDLELIQY